MRRIIQIIPAPDWYALYEEEGEEYWTPLACWALVDEDGETRVVGLEAGERVVFCEENPNFKGYISKEDLEEEE